MYIDGFAKFLAIFVQKYFLYILPAQFLTKTLTI